MSPEMAFGPNFGVSRNIQPSSGERQLFVVGETHRRKAAGELVNLAGEGMPPDFVDVVGSLVSPDGRRQILYVIEDDRPRGVRNPNPWSGHNERILFRHKGPGYGNPYVPHDAWMIHTFSMPEQTLVEVGRILSERQAEPLPQLIAA